jgi:hypothetical protein
MRQILTAFAADRTLRAWLRPPRTHITPGSGGETISLCILPIGSFGDTRAPTLLPTQVVRNEVSFHSLFDFENRYMRNFARPTPLPNRKVVIMKKTAVIILVLGLMLSMMSFVPAPSPATILWPMEGADGKSIGCFCCVKGTCVVTKNEADCKKIGGVKIDNCKACEKAAQKAK